MEWNAVLCRSVKEALPPALGSTSAPPPAFDGATRLYICYFCPFAQRAWVTRNFKGLQDKIKLVAIDLQDKPAWYKEKVYPQGTVRFESTINLLFSLNFCPLRIDFFFLSPQVPSLEHNNEVKGESLDLIKYIDSNFDGPALLPEDAEKRQFADELIAFADAFTNALYSPLIAHADMSDEAGKRLHFIRLKQVCLYSMALLLDSLTRSLSSQVAALDKLEAALTKFDDGPLFLGQFSLADIAFVTILERVQIYYYHVRNYEITKGRPNLQKFMEEMNKIEAYTQTKNEPLSLLDIAKNHLKVRHSKNINFAQIWHFNLSVIYQMPIVTFFRLHKDTFGGLS
ncbi:hypothetical protein PR202_gb19457 [Eleusine coracana subsp. coracana]|uniref:Uncharacterized protein n=1 Tax=Eleusine coracana subsp. coracana TaxID=191504 RepID=A0AAV5F850_ELECO|nr:hypothetical protein PR202_gb19457 [Eleusine coracana subsp. coracana]